MRCLIFSQVFVILFLSVLEDYVHSSAEGPSYFFYQQFTYPRDCQEVFQQCSSNNVSGVYLINPDGYDVAFEVYCDNQVDDGGWTVFQRRSVDNFVEFRRAFSEYRDGFGFLHSEFWLGNERLSFLTNQKKYQLRIDMTNSAGSSLYLTYDLFRISDAWSNYTIISIGKYEETDSLYSQCPANTVFGPCACQGTCEDPAGCHKNCTLEETCACPAGFLLSGNDCVPQEQCSCYDSTFGVIPRNGSYFSLDCSEHCTCANDSLTCNRNLQCDTNAVCEERNNVRKCYCNEGYTGGGLNCTRTAPYTDCYDVFTSGLPDGVYTIQPSGWTGSPFEVYCNMSHGGGWTVIQRRVGGSLSFNRNWARYKAGFGSAGPNENVWLGNEILHHMTNQKNYKLRIDVSQLYAAVDWYMNYDLFRVNNERNKYRLQLGRYTGNAGSDYMRNHRGRSFSTPDRDNDGYSYYHCANYYDAGWWYGNCYTANLNGVYPHGIRLGYYYYNYDPSDTYRLRYTQMKIRPL
ncbi:Angiopoietin-1 [Holothuria leucospilota]|uniref:Angiopoietin-1 n=1 Tax=Holothuria leucospilota TaxID=206669 RepID=A0A9Q1BZB6_HOLLE|nr:Angiopoietin-1 [Holothuria leucospilota]